MVEITGRTYILVLEISICSEGGKLEKCSKQGCPAVQHAECSADQTTKLLRQLAL